MIEIILNHEAMCYHGYNRLFLYWNFKYHNHWNCHLHGWHSYRRKKRLLADHLLHATAEELYRKPFNGRSSIVGSLSRLSSLRKTVGHIAQQLSSYHTGLSPASCCCCWYWSKAMLWCYKTNFGSPATPNNVKKNKKRGYHTSRNRNSL